MKKLASILILLTGFLAQSQTISLSQLRPGASGSFIYSIPSGTTTVWTATTSINWNKISSTPTTLSGYGITNAVVNTSSLTINGVSKTFTSTPVFTTPLSDVLSIDPSTGGTPITSPDGLKSVSIGNSGVTMSSGGGGEFGVYTSHAYMSADFQSATNIESNTSNNVFNHNIANRFNAPVNDFTGSLRQNNVQVATLTGSETLTNKSITSPTLTGTPIAPTPTVTSNDNSVATSSFVTRAITNASGNYVPQNAVIDVSSTATVTGWSSTTVKVITYQDMGLYYLVTIKISGTSDLTTATINFGLTNNGQTVQHIAYVQSAGTGAAGRFLHPSGSSTLSFTATAAGGAFSASGTKQAYVTYELYK